MASTVCDERAKPGDLIEIFRGGYQHWAVYAGNGYVVHLTSSFPCCVMSPLTFKAIVKKEKRRDVVGTNRWNINNNLDSKYKPRPARVIVKEACAMVGAELPYSAFSSNCEHFVNELRYGKAESQQVREAGRKAGEAVMAAGPLGFVAGYAVLSLLGDDEDKEEKRNHAGRAVTGGVVRGFIN